MTQEKWRGIGKLIEEAGEVLQLLGKVVPFPDGPHPDGKGALRDRLPIELADLKAAIHYFETENDLAVLGDRYLNKARQFKHWGLTGIMDLQPPQLLHTMACALHIGKECDCGVATRTTGPVDIRQIDIEEFTGKIMPIKTDHASLDPETGEITLHVEGFRILHFHMKDEKNAP